MPRHAAEKFSAKTLAAGAVVVVSGATVVLELDATVVSAVVDAVVDAVADAVVAAASVVGTQFPSTWQLARCRAPRK